MLHSTASERQGTRLVNKISRSFLGITRTTFNENQGLEYLDKKKNEKELISQSFEEHGKAETITT